MTPIEKFKKTTFSQIFSWTILVAGFTSGLIIWIFNNKIEDIKIKCETQSAKYELQITELTIKVNRLKGNVELYSEKFDALKVDKFSDWIGEWDTHYKNGFRHNLIFRKEKESLLGKYSFKDSKDIETNGFIQVYELTDKYLKGFWTQTKNGKTYKGKLQFILNEDKIGFEGFYSKQAESYRTDYIWNGKKKMKLKTFHIRLSKEHISSDEEKLNDFLNDKEVLNTFAELVKTEKVNFWSIVIAYNEQIIDDKSGKFAYSKDAELTKQEQNMINALKKWRTDTATKENVPQFVIAHDRELITIVKQKIENINDLKKIKGFGEKKIAKYGNDIIALLNSLI